MPAKDTSAVYAQLDQPFDQPVFDVPDSDYGHSDSQAYPLRPMHPSGGSFFSRPKNDKNTSFVPYDSPQVINRYKGDRRPVSQADQYGQPWEPGFLERLPWLGILALIATVACTFAAVALLVSSDGRPINTWSSRLQPTVYVSITTALANIFLTYALYQGIVISFWRKAVEGATLAEMHQHWNSGASFWGAVRGMFHWRAKAVSVACIMTVISILRGPLMQRSTEVQDMVRQSNGTLTAHAAPQLPVGWAGLDLGRTSTPSLMNPNFTSVFQDYSLHKPMTIVHSSCGSTCHTSIEAFGFGVSCNKTGVFYSINPIEGPDNVQKLIAPVNVFTSSAGATPIYGHGLSPETYEPGQVSPNTALLLNTTLIAEPHPAGNGTMTEHLCALRAGVVSYPVVITNGIVNFQSSSWRNDTFLYDSGFAPYTENLGSNLGGFNLAANNLYNSTAAYQFGGGVGYIITVQGALANTYMRQTSNPDYPGQFYYDTSVNISFQDPMEDMINGMRELAFRSALDVAKWNLTYPNSTHDYLYTGGQPQTIYVSNYHYMAAAVVVSLLGVIAVIPTYRGWWLLGRSVTLSPLEVAKAFDAPLFADVQSNYPAEQILRDIGGRMVRYGDVSGVGDGFGGYNTGGRRRLQVLDANMVRRPSKGVRYL